MPGLVPGIHVFLLISAKQGVDGRDKPGHDGVFYFFGFGAAFSCTLSFSSTWRSTSALRRW